MSWVSTVAVAHHFPGLSFSTGQVGVEVDWVWVDGWVILRFWFSNWVDILDQFEGNRGFVCYHKSREDNTNT